MRTRRPRAGGPEPAPLLEDRALAFSPWRDRARGRMGAPIVACPRGRALVETTALVSNGMDPPGMSHAQALLTRLAGAVFSLVREGPAQPAVTFARAGSASEHLHNLEVWTRALRITMTPLGNVARPIRTATPIWRHGWPAARTR